MSELGFQFPKKRLACMIYAAAGQGKTISAMTLCLVKGLKVRVICTEANAVSGIQEALEIHKIELEEGQLTIAIAESDAPSSLDTFQNEDNDDAYRAIFSRLMNFKGFDVKTGKEVALGNVFNWKQDCALVLDGMTMTEFACSSRGKMLATQSNNAKDARAVFYAGQKVLIGATFQLVEKAKCHIIVLAHQALSDEEAVKKYKLEKKINPAVGTRSVIDKLSGRFSNIFYMRYNKLKKQYVWSVAEDEAYTVARNIDLALCKKENLQLNNLPADFSHPIYSAFF